MLSSYIRLSARFFVQICTIFVLTFLLMCLCGAEDVSTLWPFRLAAMAILAAIFASIFALIAVVLLALEPEAGR
ncbi:hypothetical protein OVY29_21905 [Sphingopyxis sp. SE2]|uniref:hypothetical protein n=1 Tax=Sphingopyxis sp. SE2 TaxID=1586240 RepID=UPI0028C258DF|nr:hypothetical protein [Sphingopyxis sp. SE2]MDT7531316.1 hypothetical protein [Sphingopyxis sp. SE2]